MPDKKKKATKGKGRYAERMTVGLTPDEAKYIRERSEEQMVTESSMLRSIIHTWILQDIRSRHK